MATDLELSVSTHGNVSAVAKQRAEEKVGSVASQLRDPILYGEVRLETEPNPGQDRPAVAEATLSVNGTPIRAHVAAVDMDAAIDLLEERLKRRVVRYEQRLHREGKARHWKGDAEPHEWRHGDQPTHRPEWFDRPVDEREMIRHKTFALEEMTVDEAAFDLDTLAHDFYLFTEMHTGNDCVVFYDEDDHALLLQTPEGTNDDLMADTVARVKIVPPAPTLSLQNAKRRLEDGGEKWVFFMDADTQHGRVIYHRYDGHYGLITSAAED